MNTKTKPIRVEIRADKFWKIGNPVLVNVSVFKELRDAGIPVDGGIELRGVLHGRLACWREPGAGCDIMIYEWAPGPDTPAARPALYTDDDEI